MNRCPVIPRLNLETRMRVYENHKSHEKAETYCAREIHRTSFRIFRDFRKPPNPLLGLKEDFRVPAQMGSSESLFFVPFVSFVDLQIRSRA
jgi:hypothetical protein